MENLLYTQNELPLVMSVAEAAHILRIGRNRAYELIRSGQLEALRIGRQLKVTRHGLLKFLGVQAQ